MKPLQFAATVACFCLWAATAQAHPNHTLPGINGPGTNGLVAGLAHPLFGIDHLLAMLAVGMLSAQIGGRALWAIPTAFVASMIAGCTGGAFGWSVPAIEYGIALSIVLLGVAIAFNHKFSLAVPLTAAAIFGFMHGHAHGTEMPLATSAALYATGFVLATIGLHVAGVLVGRWAIGSTRGATALRLSGGAIATAGLFFLLR